MVTTHKSFIVSQNCKLLFSLALTFAISFGCTRVADFVVRARINPQSSFVLILSAGAAPGHNDCSQNDLQSEKERQKERAFGMLLIGRKWVWDCLVNQLSVGLLYWSLCESIHFSLSRQVMCSCWRMVVPRHRAACLSAYTVLEMVVEMVGVWPVVVHWGGDPE